MTTDLIAGGRMSYKSATYREGDQPGKEGDRPGNRGGAFPMSMGGAEAAAGELEAERRTGRSRSQRSEAAQELAQREISLAERWLNQQMQAESRSGWPSKSECADWIYAKLLGFYQMHIRSAKKAA